MKVAMISESDTSGGAAKAANRLHRGLVSAGIDSQMIVQRKVGDDANVISAYQGIRRSTVNMRGLLDRVPLQLYRGRAYTPFASQMVPDVVARRVREVKPDLINLHWIGHGFMMVESLRRLPKPIVWTLHDMWVFTGGCHYAGSCVGYQTRCGTCPQLGSNSSLDLSRLNMHRKERSWDQIVVVTPSRWLAKCAASSSLLAGNRIEVIPNGLDPTVYRPIDKREARSLLGLPEKQPLLLMGSFSASDPRKGLDLLADALGILKEKARLDELEVVAIGAYGKSEKVDTPFKTHFLGRLADDVTLALAYSAADVFVSPSREDNLPNTVMEASACGTPSVAFDIGGMPDLIEDGATGYLARELDVEDLAVGIEWVLEDSERRAQLSAGAREKVLREFTQEIQSKRYTTLFESLLP